MVKANSQQNGQCYVLMRGQIKTIELRPLKNLRIFFFYNSLAFILTKFPGYNNGRRINC
tara:strand:+ start:5676 stop:5852 length:177 start_codon:yes stop_codon:yes gene_type:complete